MDSLDYWQETKHTVAQRDKYILETGQFSDCNILLGEGPQQQILKVHKLILAKASRVFEAMFYGAMAETNDTVVINDVQPETLKALLEYIYTDVVNIRSFELACELCYCAKKYMFPFLIEECTKFILANLSPKTVCRAYEFAKLFERPVLMEKCLEFIRKETKSILNDSSFEDIELETMLTIFEQAKLNIDSEIELLSATERWARSECIRKGLDPENSNLLRSVIGSALSKIRFLTVTPQAFAEESVRSLLLKENEVIAIMRNVSGGNLKWPMPEGLSTNSQSRVCPPKQQPRKFDFSEKSMNDERYYQMLKVMYLPIQSIRISATSILSFKIAVNRKIRITGVQVPTRYNIGVGHGSKQYVEKLSFELFDNIGFRLTSGSFEEFVDENSVLTLKFDKPVYAYEGSVYRISIKFINGGTYLLKPHIHQVCDVIPCFSFGSEGTCANATHSAIIHSLVYTID